MNANADEENVAGAVEGATAALVIPDDMVQQVLAFVESLQAEDDEVTGHMLSTGLTTSFSGTLGFKDTSHTGITTFQTGAQGTDLKWSDEDTITG